MLSKGLTVQRLTTIERAFMLAEEGNCRTVSDIRVQLKREQHESVDAHLAGSSVQRQLKQRMAGSPAQDAQPTTP